MSKFLLSFIIILSISGTSYSDSKFSETWGQVKSDPYWIMPQYIVSVENFFGLDFTKFPFIWRNKLQDRSYQTLEDSTDISPYFDKVLHSNGICLKGTWDITEETDYTGYFASGSSGLIIARVSTALSATKQWEERAFGLAGKIYPTQDENHTTPLQTANFFTIENLGGIRRDYFLDAQNTNDIIQISPTLTALLQAPLGIMVADAFGNADGPLTTALIRELYPVAELDKPQGVSTKQPVWLKITGSAETPRVLKGDFRNELKIENYADGISMDIITADTGARLGEKEWRKIGTIRFDDSTVSNSCDHRLHFQHPLTR